MLVSIALCSIAIILSLVTYHIDKLLVYHKWRDTYASAVLQDRMTDELLFVFKKGFFRRDKREMPVLVMKGDTCTNQKMSLNEKRVEFKIDGVSHASNLKDNTYFKTKRFKGLLL